MNLINLIDALEGIRGEDGAEDLEVFCTSDHGQDYENVFSVSVDHYGEDESEVWPIHPDDLDEWLEDGNEPKRAIFIN